MTPTREDIILLIRSQVGYMGYIKEPMNSLRLGHLRQLAVRLIELIDAVPEPERSDTTGMGGNGDA